MPKEVRFIFSRVPKKNSMKEIEVRAEFQLNSPLGQRAFEDLQEFMSREESNCMESLKNTGQGGEA